jgi:hypothetical protein
MADDAVPTGENLETDDREAKDLAKRLRKGKLPQMVDWFDPLVLSMVGVRTLISTTIGGQPRRGRTGDRWLAPRID